MGLRVTDFDPLEVARQITIIEFEMFKAIKPTEFLDQAWLSKEKEKLAPGILSMTKWSTRVLTSCSFFRDELSSISLTETAVQVGYHRARD